MEFSERSRWYDLRRHWTGSGVARRTNIKIVLRFARYTARTVYNTTASTAVVRRRQRILLCACAFRATTLTEVIPRIHDSQRCQISTPTSCRLDRPSCSDDFFFFSLKIRPHSFTTAAPSWGQITYQWYIRLFFVHQNGTAVLKGSSDKLSQVGIREKEPFYWPGPHLSYQPSLRLQFRFGGKLLKIRLVCPPNGSTAVLEGLSRGTHCTPV